MSLRASEFAPRDSEPSTCSYSRVRVSSSLISMQHELNMTKYGRRDFFPEDFNILDFLSTLFQLIFSQLRKTPTVPLQLLHKASAAHCIAFHCAQNNTKKWRFSRATICMVFLLWDMIFTKVITWAEKISTLYTQLWARGSEALCSEATVLIGQEATNKNIN